MQKLVPIVGCPANRSSVVVVKMLISISVLREEGTRRKTVLEKLNSRAMVSL